MPTKTQLTAILALSVLFWAALLYWKGAPLTLSMFAPFGSVVSAISAVIFVFDAWLWKWPIFQGWFIKRPVLIGTWRGELNSDWINPRTGQAVPTINCFVIIRQTLSRLSVRLVTEESVSESVSAGIEFCTDGTFEISCTYRNKPKAAFRYRSEVHYGSMLLSADGAFPKRLEGEYWTDRKTLGSLVITDRRGKMPVSFAEAQELYEA